MPHPAGPHREAAESVREQRKPGKSWATASIVVSVAGKGEQT